MAGNVRENPCPCRLEEPAGDQFPTNSSGWPRSIDDGASGIDSLRRLSRTASTPFSGIPSQTDGTASPQEPLA
jgi:hypothetical protein